MDACTTEPLEAVRLALGRFSSIVSTQKAELIAVFQEAMVKMESEWDRLETIQGMLDRKQQRLVNVQDAMTEILGANKLTMPLWIRKELQPSEEEEENLALQQPRQHRRTSRSKWQGVRTYQSQTRPRRRQTAPPPSSLADQNQRALQVGGTSPFAKLQESLKKGSSTSRESSSSMGTSSSRAQTTSPAAVPPEAWSVTASSPSRPRSTSQEQVSPSKEAFVGPASPMPVVYVDSVESLFDGASLPSMRSSQDLGDDLSSDEINIAGENAAQKSSPPRISRNQEVPDSWLPS